MSLPQSDAPFPSDPADIDGGIRKEFWAFLSADSEREARTQTIDRMCQKIGNKIMTVDQGWGSPGWQSQLELHVRLLWQVIYDTVRHLCDDANSRNRLVVEFMLIKGMGRLGRSDALRLNRLPFTRRPDVELSTPTSDGYLFSDMPFFAHDMTRLWLRDRAILSRQQRVNLHWFWATVSAMGVDDRLCGIGIMVLRDARETPPSERVSDLNELARLWLNRAHDRFLRLAETNFADLPPSVGALGQLARDAGVPDNGGFSLERLHFWAYGTKSALPEPDHDGSRRRALEEQLGHEIPEDMDVDEFAPPGAESIPGGRWYSELD